MAIVFTKNPSITDIQSAFNNNVVEFSSDSGLDSVKCTIVLTYNFIDYIFVITPNTNNDFYFNLKEISSKLAKINKFDDSLTSPVFGLNDYDFLFNITVNYIVELSNGSQDSSFNTYFFQKSLMQINNPYPNIFNTTDTFDVVNYYDLTMFDGYPFDITVYAQNNFTIFNTANSESLSLTLNSGVTQYRLFLSNGYLLGSQEGTFFTRVNELSGGFTVENSCFSFTGSNVIETGLNALKLIETGGVPIDFNLDVKQGCGIYLKYFNNYGNYSYWLFEDVYTTNLKTSTTDTVSSDFLDIDETFATEFSTGKTSSKEITLRTKNLNSNQRKQLESLFTSPRVEMYLGSKGDIANDLSNKWQTVLLSDGSFSQGSSKRELSNAMVTIKVNHYSI
tara:strand:- start:23988 stop:25163 length:1176 start_codon:yes stop_codon:yes gene_type:complete